MLATCIYTDVSAIHHSQHTLMNSVNKTKAAIFYMQAMLPEGFPVHLDLMTQQEPLELLDC